VTTKNAVTKLAHEVRDEDEFQLLSTGYWAKIVPVGATLIQEASRSVQDPPIPVVRDEVQGDIENPMDPNYARAMEAAEARRETVATDTIIFFGVKLRDPIPPKEEWLKLLQWREKKGTLDLSSYDLDDELDLELMFKKYIAVGTMDLIRIGAMAGLQQGDVEAAMASFKSP